MAIDTNQINRALAEIRGTAQRTEPLSSNETSPVDFAEAVRKAIEEVNQSQTDATVLTERFVSGDTEVNLQDVMINLQKANVSFQQMVQVRNRLVTAYQEVMNMQV